MRRFKKYLMNNTKFYSENSKRGFAPFFENKEYLFYIGPAFIVTFILMFLPLCQIIIGSLHKWEFGKPLFESSFVGLKNYLELNYGYVSFGKSLKLTAIYGFGSLIIELCLGLLVAVLLTNLRRARGLFSAIFIIPIVIMPAMVGLTWKMYLSYDGLVNWVLSLFFIPKVNWMGSELALISLILVDVWQWTPFFILILFAGLQTLPKDPVDAIRVDGANAFQAFYYIKLPLLTPLIIIVSILRIMEIIRNFDIVFAIYQGGPGSATETLPIAVWRMFMSQRQVGMGSAFSLILIILSFFIALVFINFLKKTRVTH